MRLIPSLVLVFAVCEQPPSVKPGEVVLHLATKSKTVVVGGAQVATQGGCQFPVRVVALPSMRPATVLRIDRNNGQKIWLERLTSDTSWLVFVGHPGNELDQRHGPAVQLKCRPDDGQELRCVR